MGIAWSENLNGAADAGGDAARLRGTAFGSAFAADAMSDQ